MKFRSNLVHAQTMLQVEELSARELPSAALPIMPGMTAVGTFTMSPQLTNTVAEFALSGYTRLAGSGKFQVTGPVYDGAFGGHVTAGGTLTFKNPGGAMTVDLAAKVNPASKGSAMPHDFYFQIMSGVGQFNNVRETGTLALSLTELGATGDFKFRIMTAAPAKMTTGIQGLVLIGPIGPLNLPGEPNTRPAAGATISAQSMDGTNRDLTTQTDANGRYQLALAAGDYVIVVRLPGTDLKESTTKVHLDEGQIVTLSFTFDTGIR